MGTLSPHSTNPSVFSCTVVPVRFLHICSRVRPLYHVGANIFTSLIINAEKPPFLAAVQRNLVCTWYRISNRMDCNLQHACYSFLAFLFRITKLSPAVIKYTAANTTPVVISVGYGAAILLKQTATIRLSGINAASRIFSQFIANDAFAPDNSVPMKYPATPTA